MYQQRQEGFVVINIAALAARGRMHESELRALVAVEGCEFCQAHEARIVALVDRVRRQRDEAAEASD